jgi:eukaryotic-like serine/threonine-protein kinase
MARPGDAPPSFRDGQRVGSYEVMRLVGRGGMADVYKAVRLDGTGAFVALKAMKSTLRDDPMYIEMFVEEGRLGLLLDHPNLIRTLEVSAGEQPFIAMEYVGGIDLSRILRYIQKFGERLSYSEAAYIAHGIASALAYAHALTDSSGKPLNLVNRDVSPQNVRMALDGSVKLFDFGIARNAQRLVPEVGFVKGKQRYMSPEQIRGLPVDSRSDVFSFGIVMHELLTGRPLFGEQNQFQLADSISSARIEPPSRASPRTPPELDEVCMSCLRQRPDDRIASLSLVLDTLVHFAGDLVERRANLARYLDSTFPGEIEQDREDVRERRDPRSRTVTETTSSARVARLEVAPDEAREDVEDSSATRLMNPADRPFRQTPPGAAPATAQPARNSLVWVAIAGFACLVCLFVIWIVTRSS